MRNVRMRPAFVQCFRESGKADLPLPLPTTFPWSLFLSSSSSNAAADERTRSRKKAAAAVIDPRISRTGGEEEGDLCE